MMTDLLITPIFMRRLRLVGVWDVISIRIGKETLTLSPLFQGMSNFQIRKTICLSHIVEYQPGEQVFSQGELGSDLYVVLSGFGEIVHSDGRHRKIIAQCGPGEVVGEAGYAGGTRRMATFRSSKGDNLCVLRLNAREVSDTMRLYPWLHAKLNKNINAILALHLSRTGEKLVHESSPRTA